jgi:hypothetical protein
MTNSLGCDFICRLGADPAFRLICAACLNEAVDRLSDIVLVLLSRPRLSASRFRRNLARNDGGWQIPGPAPGRVDRIYFEWKASLVTRYADVSSIYRPQC